MEGPAMTPEAAVELEHGVQADCLSWLLARGYRMQRTNAGSFRRGGRYIAGAKRGTPDLTGYAPDGRYVAIEIETDRESQRSAYRRETKRLQREFVLDVLTCGGIGLSGIRSVADLEAALASGKLMERG